MKKIPDGGVPPYRSEAWSPNVSVEIWPNNQLFISGTRTDDSLSEFPRNVFLLYLSSVKTEYAQGASVEPSPHTIFGNATSDEKLIEFVRRFGPLIASPWRSSAAGSQNGWLQDMSMLRSEQRTFAAALGLLAEIRRGDLAGISVIQQYISHIRDGVSSWPGQCEAETHLRSEAHHKRLFWTFDYDRMNFIWDLHASVLDSPIAASNMVLCELINAFPTTVQYWGDRPIEFLPYNSLTFGVRPALYQILRHLYLGGTGALVCDNDRCHQFFDSKRSGQRFCSLDCSQQARQRKYWDERGISAPPQPTRDRRDLAENLVTPHEHP
jgi:hypothetical protein